MATDIGSHIMTAARPVLDIPPPLTPTVRAAGAAADLAPAAGLDFVLLGGMAAVVAGVLAWIVHKRRGR